MGLALQGQPAPMEWWTPLRTMPLRWVTYPTNQGDQEDPGGQEANCKHSAEACLWREKCPWQFKASHRWSARLWPVLADDTGNRGRDWRGQEVSKGGLKNLSLLSSGRRGVSTSITYLVLNTQQDSSTKDQCTNTRRKEKSENRGAGALKRKTEALLMWCYVHLWQLHQKLSKAPKSRRRASHARLPDTKALSPGSSTERVEQRAWTRPCI